MTAYVIPNAIGITDQGTKYTFASFLARDTAYDVMYSVWRNGGPLRSASPGSEGTPGVEGGIAAPMQAGGGGAGGTNVRKATQCACSKAGAHYPNTAMDVVVPGTPEQIYNLMFASGFIKDFLAKDQRLMGMSLLSPVVSTISHSEYQTSRRPTGNLLWITTTCYRDTCHTLSPCLVDLDQSRRNASYATKISTLTLTNMRVPLRPRGLQTFPAVASSPSRREHASCGQAALQQRWL